MESIGTWWMWAGFFAVVLVMLAIDLFLVGGGKQHRVSFREAASWSALWVMTTVVVCRSRLACSSACNTCTPVAESSAPVGSSQSITTGRLAMARAMATRCCSPPDSCDGK